MDPASGASVGADLQYPQYPLPVPVFSLFYRQWIAGQQRPILQRRTAPLTEQLCGDPTISLCAMARVLAQPQDVILWQSVCVVGWVELQE